MLESRKFICPGGVLPAHSGPISRYSRLKEGSLCLSCEKMAAWSRQLLGKGNRTFQMVPQSWDPTGLRKADSCQENLVYARTLHWFFTSPLITLALARALQILFLFVLHFHPWSFECKLKSCLKCFESCFIVLLFQTLVFCSLIRITDICSVIHTYFPIQSLADAPRIQLDKDYYLHLMH